ncbi:MAG TPA: alpha/beta hydrolase, partial [Candidatus Limnocylindrales bacterium]
RAAAGGLPDPDRPALRPRGHAERDAGSGSHPGGLLDAGAVALQDSIDEFVAWCGREPSCVLHGRDVKALIATIFGRIDREEIIIPGDPPRPARPFDFIQVMTEALRFPAWAAIAEFLLAVENEVTPRSMAMTMATTSPGVPFAGRAVRCADFLLPMRDHAEYTRLVRRSATVTPDMRYPADRMDQVIRCLGTPAPIPNPQHKLRVHQLKTPILLVNNRHDPITGYTMATAVAQQLGRNGRLLTHDGWGHGAYGRSACIDAIVDRYLVTLELPLPGTSCPGVPFPEGGSTPLAARS